MMRYLTTSTCFELKQGSEFTSLLTQDVHAKRWEVSMIDLDFTMSWTSDELNFNQLGVTHTFFALLKM